MSAATDHDRFLARPEFLAVHRTWERLSYSHDRTTGCSPVSSSGVPRLQEAIPYAFVLKIILVLLF